MEKKKKILLIEPPFQKFMGFSKGGIPLGLLSLAGTLKQRGHEVEVLDSDYNPDGVPYPFMSKIEHYDEYLNSLESSHPTWDGIKAQIEESKPDAVGISFISTKVRSGLRVAQIANDLGVDRIVAGGPHATIRPRDLIKPSTMKDARPLLGSPIDYVVAHELCHLKHPNHQLEFWKLLESIMPDYADRRHWLKQNVHKLGL